MRMVAFVVVVAVGCSKGEAPKTEVAANSAPTVQSSTAAPEPPKLDPLDEIMLKSTLVDAIEYAKPFMKDAVDNSSSGSALLALWGRKNMKLSELLVSANETTFALIKKDSEEQRGKKMCAPGAIIQIAKKKAGDGSVYVGLMRITTGDILHFVSVGSTGTLVEHDIARFCGIVVGRYDYHNSGGGTGHAVETVGMFKIPENEAKK